MRRTAVFQRTLPIVAASLFVVAIFTAGCSKPPTEEMLRAEKALKMAQDGDARRYAQRELEAALFKFEKARELVASRRYDDARAAAAEVETITHQAETLADIRKKKMKLELEQKIGDLRTLLGELRQRTESLSGEKMTERRAQSLEMLAGWDAEIGSVEAAADAGDLRELSARLAAVSKDIDRNAGNITGKHDTKRKKGGP